MTRIFLGLWNVRMFLSDRIVTTAGKYTNIKFCKYFLHVVAKITHPVGPTAASLYTTGSDQHQLTVLGIPGSLRRTMLLWDVTPHLQWSIFSDNSTIMMTIDTGHCRRWLCAVFEVGEDRTFCCAIRSSTESQRKN